MVFYLYGHETSLNYVYLHFLNVKDEILNEYDSPHMTIGTVMEKKIIIISNEMVPFILKLNTENYCIFIKTQWAKKQSIFAKYYSVLPILFIHTIRFSVQYFSTFVLYL